MNEMEKIIFAITSTGIDPDAAVLAASIRKFGGSLAKSPIWVFSTKKPAEIPEKIRLKFEKLNVEMYTIKPKSNVDMKFPFISFTLAAAQAEKMAEGKTELLVFLDQNSVIINEPADFLLDKGKNLGYRPVHHTLIGSHYDKPLDTFWKLVYDNCEVKDAHVFPMKTHVDGNILRPYINSGFLVTRPEKKLFAEWWIRYEFLYQKPAFKELFEKDDLYVIFTHQAILSAVVIATMKVEELQELPFSYNYPIHLYPESSSEYQPKSLNEMVTLRYYMTKLVDSEWCKQVPLEDPLKRWILNEIESLKLTKKNENKKVKFGKVALIYPIPIALVGALVDGVPNFETIGDVAIMGLNPALVVISSGADHHTNKGILEHETFSINFPTTKMLPQTDYCGTVSGRDVDKGALFDVFYGELENTPMIQECPVNIECKVLKEFSIQHRQIFVAEVAQTHVTEKFVTEQDGHKRIVEMTELDPIIYALDNKYYKIGEPIGLGYKENKKLKK